VRGTKCLACFCSYTYSKSYLEELWMEMEDNKYSELLYLANYVKDIIICKWEIVFF
jgi:hypothetical protein